MNIYSRNPSLILDLVFQQKAFNNVIQNNNLLQIMIDVILQQKIKL